MKTNKIIIKQIFFWLIAVAMITVACTKNPDANPTLRLFKPVMATDPVVTGNQIALNWYGIKGSVSYTAVISRDTTFANPDKIITVSKDTTTAVFTNLLWETKYRIRLTANAADPAFNSKIVVLNVTTAKFPTILVTPTVNDMTDYSIVVRWTNTGATATSITVAKTDGTVVKTVALNATDITAQLKEIVGLTGSTTYKVSIFSGITLRGTQNYTTTAPPQLGSRVIDLRSITGRPTILTDTMATATSGYVYIVRRNETYTCNTAVMVLNKSFTVICLPGLGNASQLNYVNETDLSGAIDSIKFMNVSISGLKSDASKVAYMFNTTSSYNCNVGKISFENCTVRNFGNAIVRLQTGAAPWGIVNKIYVNNSIINDIGNTSAYGIFHAANGSANGNKINNLEVRNSTFYNFTKGLMVNSMASSVSILVESCTFNDMISANNYFIDCNTYTVSSVAINNSILGKTKDAALSKGVRASASTTVNTTNCYNTNDFFLAGNLISGLSPFSGASTDLFNDPTNGVFTFKATSYGGKTSTGDPRWR